MYMFLYFFKWANVLQYENLQLMANILFKYFNKHIKLFNEQKYMVRQYKNLQLVNMFFRYGYPLAKVMAKMMY